MTCPAPARIAAVAPGSLAARARLKAGEALVSVNGHAPRDYIEYRYLIAEPILDLILITPTGRERPARIEKEIDADLGLRFDRDIFDGLRTCRNDCVFCFVSQLPPNVRPSLWVRDDDYRLSFLHGNFVTLTNLCESDWQRLLDEHLSPLYVSVHTTNDALRARLLGVKRLPAIGPQLERLTAGGIEVHTQVVVCPGWNDGDELARTIQELAEIEPPLASLGVVPVGLTKFHGDGPRLRLVTASEAASVVASVEEWQRSFLRSRGGRFAFASDEFYLLAGQPIPGLEAYEDFPQLSNGIGGVRQFLEELTELEPEKLKADRHVSLVTGPSAAGFVASLAGVLAAGGVRTEVHVVPNQFLGPMVTTAGLLAGHDVAQALRDQELGDLVILPATCLRDGEVFIDDMTRSDLSERCGVPVVAASGPKEAAQFLAKRSG